MLRDASEYREVSLLAHMVSSIKREPLPALTAADLVDLQEIEAGIDHNSKIGLRKYVHHRSFNNAVERYILKFGFTIHGSSPAEGVEDLKTVSW